MRISAVEFHILCLFYFCVRSIFVIISIKHLLTGCCIVYCVIDRTLYLMAGVRSL